MLLLTNVTNYSRADGRPPSRIEMMVFITMPTATIVREEEVVREGAALFVFVEEEEEKDQDQAS